MKNDHGVEPTRYMKREENIYAIICEPYNGPVFGHYYISITDKCNKEYSCWIRNNGTREFECDPIYKMPLNLNTNEPEDRNYFSLLDYEVFRISNINDYLCHICKYPDIIWEYIETKDISEESLKQVNDDTELLTDLDDIHCEDSDIRLKISRYYLKNPSELLSDTQLVNQQYDAKIREWLGNDKWKLIYRASEHNYRSYSFFEYCNNVKGPILIVIKSSGGWIFGGYKTQSWSEHCIY